MNMAYYLEKIIGQKTIQTPPDIYKRTKRKIKFGYQTRQYQGNVKEMCKKINNSGNWVFGLCNY